MVEVAHHRFGAMGTDVHIVVVGGDEPAAPLAARAEDEIREREARWSRFLSTSELSRLNAADGAPVVLEPDTYALVELAVHWWRGTDGLFDPTVLDALIAAGYDRSHESVVGRDLPDRPAPSAVPGPGEIEFDVRRRSVRLPRGIHLDLGGIGKGHAADVVSDSLIASGAAGALVNMGGDLHARGQPPEGDLWVVGIDVEPAVEVAVGHGAVTTSTTLRRHWTVAGRPMHHLIDPRTGVPAEGGLATVSVIAADAASAEVLAKAVLVTGLADGAELLARYGVTGLAVGDDGTVTRFAGFDEYEVRR